MKKSRCASYLDVLLELSNVQPTYIGVVRLQPNLLSSMDIPVGTACISGFWDFLKKHPYR